MIKIPCTAHLHTVEYILLSALDTINTSEEKRGIIES